MKDQVLSCLAKGGFADVSRGDFSKALRDATLLLTPFPAGVCEQVIAIPLLSLLMNALLFQVSVGGSVRKINFLIKNIFFGGALMSESGVIISSSRETVL